MKRFLLITVLLLLTGSTFGQTADKGFQWGVSVKRELLPGTGQYSVNATGGYRFNRGNYLGFQTGYAFTGKLNGGIGKGVGGPKGKFWGIPLMADYIHYFPIGKAQRHSLIAGIEMGAHFRHYPDAVTGRISPRPSDIITGPVNYTHFYACVKTGLDFNIVDFTHLQIGLLFSYPGIGVSVGFTF